MTAALAILGFHFTILVQMKLQTKEAIPYSILAKLSLLILTFSILLGVFIRVCKEVMNFTGKLKESMIEFISFLFGPKITPQLKIVPDPEIIVSGIKEMFNEWHGKILRIVNSVDPLILIIIWKKFSGRNVISFSQ